MPSVGAGQAGAVLAARLRALGYQDRLTLFGSDPHPPYQRPPLSKKYLSGEWPADRLYLQPSHAWSKLDIDLRCGAPVTAIDPARRTLIVGGETVSWTKLSLTTGARPRPLAPVFAGRGSVFELRTLDDVEVPGRTMLVVGGGFIGLETAAVAIEAGLQVVVVEQAGRILQRAVGPDTSSYFRTLHESRGVRIMESTTVAHVEGDTTVSAVILGTGQGVAADLILVGIGAAPDTSLAAAAGLRVGNGIQVDEYGRTSADGVWAAGDCTAFPYKGRTIRLESVQNANDQSVAVAADMVSRGTPYRRVPWFWSDQYQAKLQIAGLLQDYTRVVTRRSANGQAHWYFNGGELVAVEAINDGKAFMTARKLLEAGKSVDPDVLADSQFDPRALLR